MPVQIAVSRSHFTFALALSCCLALSLRSHSPPSLESLSLCSLAALSHSLARSAISVCTAVDHGRQGHVRLARARAEAVAADVGGAGSGEEQGGKGSRVHGLECKVRLSLTS